jgi:hypothetical protein
MLSNDHGFRHIRVVGSSGATRRRELYELLVEPRAATADLVVTWTGACPPRETREDLRSVGFEWFWLDGDRGAAALGAAAGEARFVDPFEADGSFRPVASVVAEILAPILVGAARTVPVLLR